eukprot:gene25369-33909_t
MSSEHLEFLTTFSHIGSEVKVKCVPFKVEGHKFWLDAKFDMNNSKILGGSSFRLVCSAFDSSKKRNVAIKRVRPYAQEEWDESQAMREISMLKLLRPHPNVISLFEVDIYAERKEVYLVLELMDGDLAQFLSKTKQTITDVHIKCIMKQLLEGVRAMNSIGVYHRDLRPANILISKNCEIRICGFGLSRCSGELRFDERPPAVAAYINSNFYLSPELLVSPKHGYDERMDIWSAGCIMGELALKRPLFPGRSQSEQVCLIMKLIGYSDSSDLGVPTSCSNIEFLDKYCLGPPEELSAVFPGYLSGLFNQMISELLTGNPFKRPSAEDALRCQYLSDAATFYDYSIDYLERQSIHRSVLSDIDIVINRPRELSDIGDSLAMLITLSM